MFFEHGKGDMAVPREAEHLVVTWSVMSLFINYDVLQREAFVIKAKSISSL